MNLPQSAPRAQIGSNGLVDTPTKDPGRAAIAGFGHNSSSAGLLGAHSVRDPGTNPDSCSSQSNICELGALMVPDRDVERHAGRDTSRRTARCQERTGVAALFGAQIAAGTSSPR